ncbi:MAG: DEAD/DEAH box helicase, partial [Pedobacter sp.]
MKRYIKIPVICCLLAVLGGCEKFDETTNLDPNNPAKASGTQLIANAELSLPGLSSSPYGVHYPQYLSNTSFPDNSRYTTINFNFYGFYTKDELQTLVQRRVSKKSLAKETINNAITDRYYQHEAIRKVSEAFEGKHREALLVMATGTGKTRVSASLIDFLSKANWIKRVLFLADRNALVHQAKVNFNDYLPNLPAVDLTREKEDESSRIVFSTYQTMINLIDGETDGKNRYSVGHFDLIIFDEIHRSVYNRYKHIFKYFDGFRVGLT